MAQITIEHHGKVTLFTINRPARKNAICKDTALELQAGFAEFDASEQRVAVITGAGNDAFSSGADVSNLPELWRCIPGSGFTTDKPIIAATAGWVVGGAMVLTMMCDLIVAAENTRFSYPEARLGFTGGMIASIVVAPYPRSSNSLRAAAITAALASRVRACPRPAPCPCCFVVGSSLDTSSTVRHSQFESVTLI